MRGDRRPFLAKVERRGPYECWPWSGKPSTGGYGQFGRQHKAAHVLVYEALVGPVPEGCVLDHLCRNRICCNPAHLEPVAEKTNVLRGIGPTAVNARKTLCHRGHPLDYTYPDGRRDCRTCRREDRRRYEERQRQKIIAPQGSPGP